MDGFLIEAVRDILPGLTKGKYYEVQTIFKTDECKSGYCVVIENNGGDFLGYDLGHFRFEYEE